MHRLKNILLAMDKNSSYNRLIEGPIIYRSQGVEPVEDSDGLYFYDDIGIEFSASNQMENDKPTVEIQIPLGYFGTENLTLAELNLCYRKFARILREKNNNLTNRKKLDRENGKFICAEVTNEILKSNFSTCRYCSKKDYEYANGFVVILDRNQDTPVKRKCLCMIIQILLPFKNPKKAMNLLCRDLVSAIKDFISIIDKDELSTWRENEEKQERIRKWLKESEFCAFVANGSILPRDKIDKGPSKNAIPFLSPVESLIQVEDLKGMGIKKGITIIAGGGYSGKTTFLEAISQGIYNHIPGDGREFVITSSDAFFVAVEDGRSVKQCDISPFLRKTQQLDSEKFSSMNASGSTSQASNLVEAINCGAKLLLIDEDRSATNFLIKDKKMRDLLTTDPIVPFSDRIRGLYNKNGISTIAVIGGNGDLLSKADYIFLMQGYQLYNRADIKTFFEEDETEEFSFFLKKRKLKKNSINISDDNEMREKIEVIQDRFLILGQECIDLGMIKGICDKQQITALGLIIRWISNHTNEQYIDIECSIENLWNKIEKDGLDVIFSTQFSKLSRFFTLPRKCEVMALINRLKTAEFEIEREDSFDEK